MRMYDLISKKRDGGELNKEEMTYLIEGYVKGEIPDYQMSAFLMAVYFQGMTKEETAVMTDLVARSGDVVDLSPIEGIKVDKHSTGGVGDKTTLIVGPLAAACGVKVAKMSGRGLGHTGGTVDKLESIPNMRVSLEREEFFDIVKKDLSTPQIQFLGLLKKIPKHQLWNFWSCSSDMKSRLCFRNLCSLTYPLVRYSASDEW